MFERSKVCKLSLHFNGTAEDLEKDSTLDLGGGEPDFEGAAGGGGDGSVLGDPLLEPCSLAGVDIDGLPLYECEAWLAVGEAPEVLST